MKKTILALVAAILIMGIGYSFLNNREAESEELPISAQQHVQTTLGLPAQFAVMYLPQESPEGLFLVRNDIWFYPEQGKKITFLGGGIASIEDYQSESPSPVATNLKPQDFYYDMTKEEIEEIFGQSNIEAVDYLPGFYEEGELETYISDSAIFIFEYGKLTYIQTFDLGEEKPEEGDLTSEFIENFVLIPEAHARISFKKAFRCLGRACRFIIQLPDRATRWMGPVLGPIASTILTKNLVKHPKFGKIFGKAKRINKILTDIEEQKELVGELKTAYKDQASKLLETAEEVRKSRQELQQDLLKGEVSYDDYKANVVAIDKMIEAFEKGAEKFNREADRVNLESVMKMFGKKLLNKVLGQAREILINELGSEIKKLVDPKVLDFLVAQEKKGFDAVIDLLIAGDLEAVLKNEDPEGFDIDELKARIREEIKRMLKEDKENLQKNWKQMIRNMVEEMKAQIEEEGKEYEAQQKETEQEGGGTICDREAKPTSDKCPSGYEWDPKSGVGCIQSDCYDEAIKHAHWDFTGRCVCGTSGSMNEKPTDPNKECTLPLNCGPCPGCVYACVTHAQECPPIPSK